MARTKTRMTAFSRLMLFMIFIGPLAYIAASYYNGQDGVKNITTTIQKGKNKVSTILSGEKGSTTPISSDDSSGDNSSMGSSSNGTSTSPISSPKEDSYQIKRLKDQLEELDLENRELRRTIRELKAELSDE